MQGVVYPSILAVWSRWAPPAEYTRLTLFAYSGASAGTVIGYPLCGWLAEKYGWPSTFYVPGTKQKLLYLRTTYIMCQVNDKSVFCEGFIAAIWCIVWLLFISESPLEDKYISEEELKYIVDSIGPRDDNKSKIHRCTLTIKNKYD